MAKTQPRLGGLRRTEPISRIAGFDRGQPIDRYYIDRFLARRAEDIAGRVLEIGYDTYTRRRVVFIPAIFEHDAPVGPDVLPMVQLRWVPLPEKRPLGPGRQNLQQSPPRAERALILPVVLKRELCIISHLMRNMAHHDPLPRPHPDRLRRALYRRHQGNLLIIMDL